MSDGAKPGWISSARIFGAGGVSMLAGSAIVLLSEWDQTGVTVAAAGTFVLLCSLIPKKPQRIKWNNPRDVVWSPGQTLGGIGVLNAQLVEGNGQLTYDPDAATPLEPGTHTLNVTAAETMRYYAKTAKIVLKVKKATPVVTWAPATPFDYGTPLTDADHLNATLSVPCAPPNYNQAEGAVLDAGTRRVSVTCTPNDTAHYETVSAYRDLVVNPVAPLVVWPAAAIVLIYQTNGRAVPVAVTATFQGAPVAGQLRYNNQNGNGQIHIGPLDGGARALAVTFVPTSPNFLNVPGTVNLQINPATPVLTWNPTDLDDGAALGPNQLNAQVRLAGVLVPGNYAYVTAAGGVIHVAVPWPTMTVTFVPANAANFNAPPPLTVDIPVRLTNAQKTAGGIGPVGIRNKILFGSIQPNDDLVGAHSPSIVGDPDYAIANLVVNPNGTRTVDVRKRQPDGVTWSNWKVDNTLPPANWNDQQVLAATIAVGAAAVPGGPGVNGVYGGVPWRVLKAANGNVHASYPL
jgi:hypothetical protein